ncbi:MAG: HAMP domain-containing histidine kinase, partial [Desulfobacterales bacterium]|nr:HAMP domain-containing histidine kinase [Desulfobacterales bacterium]
KGNKGTGLGLFIADKIIDQHGGKITVESRPGQGSNFKITIPGAVQNDTRNHKEKTE